MSEHKYSELADKLRADIQAGIYENGQKLPSENELAARTGYSRQTVRQTMSVLEKEGLTSRVQGSGTYVRSCAPRKNPTHIIAVVTTYIGEYIFPNILNGIEEELSLGGYTSMISATRNRVDNERKILADLLNKPIDGLIVEGTKTALPNPNIDLYKRFANKGIPVVFINGFYPDIAEPIYVVADDRAGGIMATECLLKKGHTNIAGVFKSDDIQGHRRYAGFAEALREKGLSVTDDRILWYTTENREGLIASSIMDTTAGCTAVVCYNDEIALQVMRILDNHKIRVPEDMAVISFDNSTYAKLSPIKITSLSNPKEKTGHLAARKLIDILDGKKCEPSVLPWSLSEKAST